MQPQVATRTEARAAIPSEPVWDLVVRLSHWTVAVGFFVAYFAEDVLTLHVWAGYVVGVVVLLRLVWGFVGPQRARFADFVHGPITVGRHLADFRRRR